ncbi:MAG: M24 family metallopeptidase [Candidatus Altiarchaeales archaeon]|nr:M24 family metallopeptidase [Candidatus Altiarchaeales archaeon]
MNINCELEERYIRLRKTLSKKNKPLLVSGEHNIKYLCGLETGRAVLTEEDAVLWVRKPYDEIYGGILDSKGYPFRVETYKRGCIKKYFMKHKITEAYTDDLLLSSWSQLQKKIDCKLFLCEFIERQRSIKSRYEIGCLKKSANLAKSAMDYAAEVISEGVSECMAAAKVEAFIRGEGSSSPPFGQGMLLASGKSSANIHAKPSKNKIQGMTVVDLGAVLDDYHSDMTRTFFVGKPSDTQRKLLEVMRDIELGAIDRITPGATVEEVTSYVERRLKKHNLSLNHAAGHGLGLQIHEPPYIGPGSGEVFRRDMVFTIEPGIYLPGKYGIRFEDTVLLKNKPHILTT